ncbi:MAG: alpha/beta hydrolase [Candidatus Binataceae bacterium]|nr:alpha/beta hydrolase [Candidatus Binataceae bacterium]
MPLPSPEIYSVKTPDGVDLTLTRYRGGDKGPVMLAHGAGVWSGMFMLPTIGEHFADYTVKNGYDTWLLDWRASIKLPLRQFTMDEAAVNDFPAAVRFIRDTTRAQSVQAVVHCAGSSTFFLALADGLLPDIRCVTCSQIALHYQPPAATEIKCALHLGEALESIGLSYLSAGEDPGDPIFQAIFTKMVNAINHQCDSSVCHRITFMYGELYRHEQLNAVTHSRLAEQFGKCNITAFRHLAQMVRRGEAAKFDYGAAENLRRYGSSVPPSYLKSEHLKLPITFVSGALNQTFLPVSTEKTYDWLCAANDPKLYKRHLVPAYGHIDGFMGFQANRDVYGMFLEQLESCPA